MVNSIKIASMAGEPDVVVAGTRDDDHFFVELAESGIKVFTFLKKDELVLLSMQDERGGGNRRQFMFYGLFQGYGTSGWQTKSQVCRRQGKMSELVPEIRTAG